MDEGELLAAAALEFGEDECEGEDEDDEEDDE